MVAQLSLNQVWQRRCRIETDTRYAHSANCRITTHDDCGTSTRILPSHLNSAVELGRFAQRPFAQILPGRRSHQMSVHDQNISVTVNLKKLDGPSHHIRQGRLFGPCCNFVGKRQIIGCKKSEETWLLPSSDVFELRH